MPPSTSVQNMTCDTVSAVSPETPKMLLATDTTNAIGNVSRRQMNVDFMDRSLPMCSSTAPLKKNTCSIWNATNRANGISLRSFAQKPYLSEVHHHRLLPPSTEYMAISKTVAASMHPPAASSSVRDLAPPFMWSRVAPNAAATIMNTSQNGSVVDIRNSFMSLRFICYYNV